MKIVLMLLFAIRKKLKIKIIMFNVNLHAMYVKFY